MRWMSQAFDHTTLCKQLLLKGCGCRLVHSKACSSRLRLTLNCWFLRNVWYAAKPCRTLLNSTCCGIRWEIRLPLPNQEQLVELSINWRSHHVVCGLWRTSKCTSRGGFSFTYSTFDRSQRSSLRTDNMSSSINCKQRLSHRRCIEKYRFSRWPHWYIIAFEVYRQHNDSMVHDDSDTPKRSSRTFLNKEKRTKFSLIPWQYWRLLSTPFPVSCLRSRLPEHAKQDAAEV